MYIRNKNHISYFKFLELSEAIEGSTDERHICKETKRVFDINNVSRFAAALARECKLRPRFDLDFNFNAGRFIDADTFRQDNEELEMYRAILKPRRKWHKLSRHKIEDLSLKEQEFFNCEWTEFLSNLKYRYEYIYNPPIRASSGTSSQGSVEREEFSAHYGGYAEMTYLIGKGAAKDFKDLWKWDLDFFLFWGEYLLRKRDVENLK